MFKKRTNWIGRKPVPPDESEVEKVMAKLKSRDGAPKNPFQKGDEIRVTEGPFIDYRGQIEKVVDDSEMLRVNIDIFGRDTQVELEFSQVEKV